MWATEFENVHSLWRFHEPGIDLHGKRYGAEVSYARVCVCQPLPAVVRGSSSHAPPARPAAACACACSVLGRVLPRPEASALERRGVEQTKGRCHARGRQPSAPLLPGILDLLLFAPSSSSTYIMTLLSHLSCLLGIPPPPCHCYRACYRDMAEPRSRRVGQDPFRCGAPRGNHTSPDDA